MKKKTVIVKISEGLGNQLFMYANAFSLKKKYQLNLYIDSHSGYYNKKAITKHQSPVLVHISMLFHI